MPNDRREMKGMMPNVAPQAAWAPTENMIIMATATGSDLERPRRIQKIPPIVWRIHRVHSLPLIPNLLAARSETYPPNGRAAKLAMPNVAAMIPAVWSFRSNL